MKTKLVRIRNSRGIRLPKLLIEQAGLDENVRLEVHGNTLVIRPLASIRAGWAAAAAAFAATDEGLLDTLRPSSRHAITTIHTPREASVTSTTPECRDCGRLESFALTA